MGRMSDQLRLATLDALRLSHAYVRRASWVWWEVMIHGSDGIDRPLHPRNPVFLRQSSAASVASTINREVKTAAWIALGPGLE